MVKVPACGIRKKSLNAIWVDSLLLTKFLAFRIILQQTFQFISWDCIGTFYLILRVKFQNWRKIWICVFVRAEGKMETIWNWNLSSIFFLSCCTFLQHYTAHTHKHVCMTPWSKIQCIFHSSLFFFFFHFSHFIFYLRFNQNVLRFFLSINSHHDGDALTWTYSSHKNLKNLSRYFYRNFSDAIL